MIFQHLITDKSLVSKDLSSSVSHGVYVSCCIFVSYGHFFKKKKITDASDALNNLVSEIKYDKNQLG